MEDDRQRNIRKYRFKYPFFKLLQKKFKHKIQTLKPFEFSPIFRNFARNEPTANTPILVIIQHLKEAEYVAKQRDNN